MSRGTAMRGGASRLVSARRDCPLGPAKRGQRPDATPRSNPEVFASRSAFIRAFVEASGQSPRAFRAGRDQAAERAQKLA